MIYFKWKKYDKLPFSSITRQIDIQMHVHTHIYTHLYLYIHGLHRIYLEDKQEIDSGVLWKGNQGN